MQLNGNFETGRLSAGSGARILLGCSLLIVALVCLVVPGKGAAEAQPGPGIELSTGYLAVPETGFSTFSVVLRSPPEADVRLRLSRRDGSDPDLSADTEVLTFTPATWNDPQPVAISAGEDANSGSGGAVFEFTARSDDAGYDHLEVPVLVAVEEDASARAGVNVATRLLSVGEDGAAVYTIALNSRPRGDVTVEVVRKSGAGAMTADFGTPGLSSAVFTREDWNAPRQVVVRRAEDSDAAAGEVIFTHHLSSDDDRYDSERGGGFADVTVRAPDVAFAAQGVTVSHGGVQAEGGKPGWTVVLDSPPAAPVRIAVEKVSGAGTVSAVPAMLTFTGDTWNLPQAVTVQGAGGGGSTWGYWVSSADPAYDGLVLYSALSTDAVTDTGAVTGGHLGGLLPGAIGLGTAVAAAVLIKGTEDEDTLGEDVGGTALSALSLSRSDGDPLSLVPDFAPRITEYTTATANSDDLFVTVAATAASAAATVVISPADSDNTDGHQVALDLGETEITATVTNGGDTQSYTITISRPEGTFWSATLNVDESSSFLGYCPDTCPADSFTGDTRGAERFTVPGTSDVVTVTGVVWGSGSSDLSVRLFLDSNPDEGEYELPDVSVYAEWLLAIGNTEMLLSDNDRVGVRSGDDEVSIQFDNFFASSATRPAVDTEVTISLELTFGSGGSRSATGASAAAGFSVSDAEANEGAELAFNVSLDQGLESEARVTVSTRDGSAKAGADYTSLSETLIFAPGETEKTVRVPVLDDVHDEGREEMTLVLSNPAGAAIGDGEGTGAIVNSDAVPKAWIARFGRTVTSQVLDAVEARLSALPQTGWRATLAGQALPSWNGEAEANQASTETLRSWRDWFAQAEAEREGVGFSRRSRAVTAQDLVSGTSFALSARDNQGDHFSVWGDASIAGFDGREDGLNLDGRVTTGLVGADWATDGWMAGMAIGHSVGTGGYRRGACDSGGGCGSVEADLTGLYPYAGLELSERVTAWAAAGYGAGEFTLNADGAEAITTDLTMGMGAVGLRGELLRPESAEGLSLAVKSEARVTQTSTEEVRGPSGNLAEATADVWTGRAGIEGARRFGFGSEADGVSLTPSFELGVRVDGGDAEQGFGADIGGGLVLSDSERGLSLDLSGRGLLIHEADGFREWGASAALAWDPQPTTDRGLNLSLRQSWGASPSGTVDALLGPDTFAGFVNNSGAGGSDRFEASSRLDGEVGYGLSMFGGGFTGTLNAGFGLAAGDRRDYRIGWRLNPAGPRRSDLELRLDATRREVANDDAGHGVTLRGTIRW